MRLRRPVTVYCLVANHTIEIKIVALHETKRDLAERLLKGTDVPSRLARDKITSLSVELPRALRAAASPLIHKDPFDRILVAQAQVAGLRLVTRDAWAQQYEVDCLKA